MDGSAAPDIEAINHTARDFVALRLSRPLSTNVLLAFLGLVGLAAQEAVGEEWPAGTPAEVGEGRLPSPEADALTLFRVRPKSRYR